MRVSPNVNSIDDIHENNILEIDSKAKIIEVIYQIYSQVSFDDVYYYFPGCYGENPTHSCWKLFLGDDDTVRCLFVTPHVDMCDLKVIESLCERLSCRIFDPQQSKFIY